jgi:hypothetical protein
MPHRRLLGRDRSDEGESQQLDLSGKKCETITEELLVPSRTPVLAEGQLWVKLQHGSSRYPVIKFDEAILQYDPNGGN